MSCNYCGGSGINAYYQDCPYCADDSSDNETTVKDEPDVTIIDTPTKSDVSKEQSTERSKRNDK